MFYYLSTTLSTVGLGDYRPTNNFERLLIVPVMLVGLLVFSYMNGILLEIALVVGSHLRDSNDLS